MTSSKYPVSRTIHATCVAIGSRGVLLLGKPGSGKSDLALRLIDRGARLVSDDQVELFNKDQSIIANVPDTIKGLIEIRGVGISKIPYKKRITLRLVVELAERQNVERLPEPEFYTCMGIKIPKIRIYPFDVSSAIKVELSINTESRK